MPTEARPQIKRNFIEETVDWFNADHDRIEAAFTGLAVGLISAATGENWLLTLAVATPGALAVKKYIAPRVRSALRKK